MRQDASRVQCNKTARNQMLKPPDLEETKVQKPHLRELEPPNSSWNRGGKLRALIKTYFGFRDLLVLRYRTFVT